MTAIAMADTAGAADPVVRVVALGRTYRTENSVVQALDNVSLEIGRGEFLSILGPSGCGKSTLLNVLAGFDRQTSGVAEFEGRPIPGPSPKRGVVFQDTNALFPWMTVEQNVEFGLRSLGMSRAERRERAAQALALVNLRDFASSYPRQLSGGMRQLVAIARVVVMDADLLLMDEPFAALDAITRQRMQRQLVEIWEKTRSSIMFITHSIDEAIYLGDRVAIMSARPGRIREILDVDLPRPRDLASAEFNALRGRALTHLDHH
ncbi:MAG TPA: ABC transporter ATP-binding protein [Xanthobacteraceae bacterium]|nr:ABC transporter ATP-binding protein [Xanthobacteraceae bacterium]